MIYSEHLPTLVNYVIVTFYKLEYFNQYWWMDYGYDKLELFISDLYKHPDNLQEQILKDSSPILKRFEEYRNKNKENT